MTDEKLSLHGRRVATARAELARRQAAEGVDRYHGRAARLTQVARRARHEDGGWCILRTAGPSTLRLADTLQAAGIEAWTPTHKVKRRLPRSKARVERSISLTPTYVFARLVHLRQLAGLALAPVKPHPDFSVLHHNGDDVTISDASLGTLRREVARCAREHEKSMGRVDGKRTGEPFAAGTEVEVPDPSWAGLPGVVEESDGRHTLVCFFGKVRVKVETSILRGGDV